MMKNKERSASGRSRGAYTLLVYAATAVIIVSGLLWLAISAIDGADSDIKSSPGAPEALVSVGAPRSQLALERRFSSMSRSYTENGKKVFEPITREYLGSVEERIAEGEKLSLSVEEILYIIADSVEIYDSYDVVRLYTSGGNTDELSALKDLAKGDEPYYNEAVARCEDILSLISYRILSLSSPDAYEETEREYLYMPEAKTKGDAPRGFVISKGGEEMIRGAVTFNADSGRKILLYPTEDDMAKLDTAVLYENGRALTRSENEILYKSGYGEGNHRNITPEYWYGRTDIRLVVSAGEVIIIDGKAETATAALPETDRFMSAALADTDGDGACELFFTSSQTDGKGSALWSYKSGAGVTRLLENEAEYLGVYENDGSVELYKANKTEMKKYVRALVREGEPLWKNN